MVSIQHQQLFWQRLFVLLFNFWKAFCLFMKSVIEAPPSKDQTHKSFYPTQYAYYHHKRIELCTCWHGLMIADHKIASLFLFKEIQFKPFNDIGNDQTRSVQSACYFVIINNKGTCVWYLNSLNTLNMETKWYPKSLTTFPLTLNFNSASWRHYQTHF